MSAALSEDLLATDLADYLVKKGLPFRQAHHVVGAIVRMASEQGVEISELPLDALQGVSGYFAEDVASVFDYGRSVEQRMTYGGTASAAVKLQIERAKARLE